jgi:predicted HTH transcriptional regulator
MEKLKAEGKIKRIGPDKGGRWEILIWNLIEQWGSGINRIINSCKEYGLEKTSIEEKNDFFDREFIRSWKISDEESAVKDVAATGYDRLRPITDNEPSDTVGV